MLIKDAQNGRSVMLASTRLWTGRACVLQTATGDTSPVPAVNENIHAYGIELAGNLQTETFAKPSHFQRKRLT